MAQSKYTETIEISTIVDKKQYLEFKKQFERDSQAMSLLNTEDGKKLAKSYAEVQTKMKKIKMLKEAIADIEMYGGKDGKKAIKELKQQLKEVQKTSLTDKLAKDFSSDGVIGKKVIGIFKKGGEAAADFIISSFKSAITELNNMSSYNYATTLFQKSSSLSSALQYGLSGGQSYALDKALSFFGAGSIEDTMYWNENQREAFAEKIGYYTNKYNKLNNSNFFEKWDRFQFDFKTFKEDVMYDMMDWIVSNKDTVYAGFQAITELMKIVVNILGKVADYMHISRTQNQIDSKTADIISNYSTSSSSNTLTVNNTFNGVQSSNKSELVNAGELTYAQVKQVLYGQ